MFKKGSRLYSILRFKCPQCQEGDFFVSHPYDLKKAGDIHEHCSSCGLKYSKEPGFYYGAMYVAYALGVALFVTVWVLFELLAPQLSVWWPIGVLSAATLLLAPLMYAQSKIIWINFFVRYKKPEDRK